MLDALGSRLRGILDKLKRRGKLTAADVEEGLREIRLCLLEADVNYKVVKRFIENIRAKALGAAVLESLTPGQQLIKIVRDELTTILGASKKELKLSQKPAIIMLVGLQGSGKTTTAGKLARFLNTELGASSKPLLVATDVRRPAAIEQLKQLGEKLNLPVFGLGQDALEISLKALDYARQHAHDVLIFDTAGRLQIDDELMKELELMKAELAPSEILLVADAMTGQEAVNIARAFHARLNLTGIILTKLDGDARGGAALSIVEATGVPIKLIGVGEKLEDLEGFYPQRMAERILGMGDVLSLIEQAEKAIDVKRAEELARKIQKEAFTLQDFLEQLEQLKHMGPITKLIEKIPGAAKVRVDERELVKVQAIIHSMTTEERLRPGILNGSRKKRIAKGSGTQVSDVNRLLKRFEEARKLMKQMSKGRFSRAQFNLFE